MLKRVRPFINIARVLPLYTSIMKTLFTSSAVLRYLLNEVIVNAYHR